MSTVADTFTLAFQTHQAGNLDRAEQLYRQVLQGDPNHADTHHLLGVLAYQVGRFDVAIASIRHALLLNPWVALYHNHLGLAHKAKGQMQEAAASFQQAVHLQPNNAKAHNNLGDALLSLGRQAEAIEHWQQALHFSPDFLEAHHSLGDAFLRSGQRDRAAAHYQEALRLKPDNVEAHSNLGIALASEGKFDDAMTHWQEALRLNPGHAEAHHNIGTALRSQGKWEEAILCFEKALQLKPSYADSHYNLGNVFKDQGQPDKAVGHYRQALHFNPRNANAHNNLGNILQQQENIKEAMAHYREALRLRPEHAAAHRNLGTALQGQGKWDEALAHIHQALRINPEFIEARNDLALQWLLRGDFAQGWPAYEWRWRLPHAGPRSFPQPLWNGSPLAGQTILLYAEQGLGDTLQFIRYVPLLKQAGAGKGVGNLLPERPEGCFAQKVPDPFPGVGKVIVECQPALLPLLVRVPEIDELLPRGAPLPAFDVQAPLLSLPGIFQTRLNNVPASVPYLQADASLVSHWRQQMVGSSEVEECSRHAPRDDASVLTRSVRPTLKIGIVWQGNPDHPGDNNRSVPLEQFAPLGELQDVDLVSLQVGPGIEQLVGRISNPSRFRVTDLGSRFNPASLADVAAVLVNIDLLITVDTAVAHLAGALGVPVWVALPFVPDWRWMLQREDSPWYPSMRLFRQSRVGVWDDVFERIVDEVKRHFRASDGRDSL